MKGLPAAAIGLACSLALVACAADPTPTYQLSYLFGRHMIEKLKGEVQAREGTDFDLRRFHDTLIYGGTMPVSYARRLFEENGR